MTDTLTSEQVAAYFARIGYAGAARADLPTLIALHRAHAMAIPFENLAVQLGTPPGLAPQQAFAKLVEARRGGWCYEQNGLLGAVLAALGFTVTRLAGAVLREERGQAALGSHLCLKVSLEQDWLVDVGFGGSLVEPLPLEPGEWANAPVPASLARTGDDNWRMAIRLGPSPMYYDFRDAPADEALLQRRCDWQGNDGESVFVQNLVVQGRAPGEHRMLRGRVFTRTGSQGAQQRVLASAAELLDVLSGEFGLEEPAAADLWEPICARHAVLFG